MEARSETRPDYIVRRELDDDDAIIQRAAEIMHRRMRQDITYFTRPDTVKDYVVTVTFTEQREVFGALFLDAQNGLIESEILFRGTVSQASVYPREIVKAALRHNACAVIFFHNHPSGVAEPSRADEALTDALAKALALVDVRVIDHIVAGGNRTVSFAERGLL